MREVCFTKSAGDPLLDYQKHPFCDAIDAVSRAAQPSRSDGGRRPTPLTPTHLAPAITLPGGGTTLLFRLPSGERSHQVPGSSAVLAGAVTARNGRGNLASANTSS